MIEVKVRFCISHNRLFKVNDAILYVKINEGATLRDLLTILSAKYKSIKENVYGISQGDSELVTLINGKYPSHGLSTKLKRGDEVCFFPLIAGG
jgi:MoaD family protein